MAPTAPPGAPTGELPVVVVGAGPVGLITALGLKHYGIPVVVLEEDERLSLDTKAGTVLTRTIEVLDRYGAAAPVLRAALRMDEIGEVDRATNAAAPSVKTDVLAGDTRFPFVVNIPQNSLEAVLEEVLRGRDPEVLRLRHRVTGLVQQPDHVTLTVEGPDGVHELDARYVLACDGGRSGIRDQLGITVEGKTLEERYMLVDLKVDLDVGNPRDYPYLAYFADPAEWMILVRQPHCWRFLFPLRPDAPQPGPEELRDKALRFIGEVDDVELLGTNVYTVHQRVADRWGEGRVFLMGDAAHLITPMWALGLNTGVLDASNLPWRLAWVLRGWADPALLAGYEAEQSSVAIRGSGEMAESARLAMGGAGRVESGGQGGWGWAMTRSLLGVRLDVAGTGEWSMVRAGQEPQPVRVGDRVPDVPVYGPDGEEAHLHRLAADSFVALHFADARRRPVLPPAGTPGLTHLLVSRWDAPHDSGLRERSCFDPGERLRRRLGVEDGTVVLLRPDGHIAAIADWSTGSQVAEEIYARIVRPGPAELRGAPDAGAEPDGAAAAPQPEEVLA
ncbi:FAD-dependent monooxygenase [Georgenia thermotolerans]|uniref:FAD-binding monooxygenase n=1 Tax=Georgenia thermotolerans TaxID=527326 RepID=A0A7J5UUY3_9MICO|nr:FAD-dependent monooxygenase [Georgenia thermotolerans]KAE8766104.1 FAD-binding monooxygenase [Georgenia thermotolerans]